MKLYLLSTDAFDYDDYDAFVVRAENEDAAFKHVSPWTIHGDNILERKDVTITEISLDGEEETILSSFNAG